MEKSIPLAKQSKKAQREHNAAQRGSWYGLNPVTRTVPDRKKYSRSTAKRDARERIAEA